ncbi:V/A-type H+-transporting ATPase subunit C [Moryella indoligenes]|uniref:V/A-type H+-transporting ATPase subunit C n=1 Tax=Moryella indoligenes TaxID=371674 RepID=A0AAE4ALG9_9FIRM|nr:V-type ATPase subunit [Moryella indoligenes]MDQ0152156.1 V/A-type H+-transporting ATPase subunit C [Moryella indoligenes]
MPENDFVYAVARIRAKELSLLSAAFLEQLLALPDEAAGLKLLNEHGWGSAGQDAGTVLSEERRKTWALISELTGGQMEIFDVFRCESDYHNLKAAVKDSCSETHIPGIYVEDGVIPAQLIREAAETHDFSALPKQMAAAGAEAMELLLKTGDGQLCDCVLDRAALIDMREAGKRSGEELLAHYGELRCAAANIKTAVRACRTGKDREFLQHALAPCETLNLSQLTEAAMSGMEAICSYLEHTDYADAVGELKKSPSAFERWCDNSVIRSIRPQLYNSFGPGPLAAFILARENEIRTVRIILSGKRNRMEEGVIRERVREMYV